MSVRIDPFNWLLNGRLGLELEVAALDFLTIEAIPQFVVNQQPPGLKLYSAPDTVYQKSNGLGALAGASLGLGFWLDGKPLRGTVIRAVLTNYALAYNSHDDTGEIDRTTYTERQVQALIGSHARWGAFTFAGALGLGYELTKQRRCLTGTAANPVPSTAGCKDDEHLLLASRVDGVNPPTAVNLMSPLFPVSFVGRISVGAAF